MIKTFGKLLLSLLVYTVAYFIASALMPYSAGFVELSTNGGAGIDEILFFLANSVWVCGTMYFIIKNTHYTGKRLFLNVLVTMFFVQNFMTQIETLFFSGAFPVLTKPDIVLLMVSGLIPLLVTLPLEIKFFQNEPVKIERIKFLKKSLIIRLGVIGIIYLCVYMLFGYYVAWKFEAVRVFYTGLPEDAGFWGVQVNNLQSIIIPFQVVRGILFGIFALPLVNMLTKSKTIFITGVCLVYLSTAILLMLPNPLFPDAVRLAHFIEMISSMLLFGLITGHILWGVKKEG
ncbi:MAG TPA: hypothetical protein DEQ14_05175 [Treponema sp.]|nr:hypothetical protein [Treponema sp.]